MGRDANFAAAGMLVGAAAGAGAMVTAWLLGIGRGHGRLGAAGRRAAAGPRGRRMHETTGNLPPHPAIHQPCTYLCGFHFVSGDPARQVEAHQFCFTAGEDVRQCLIFDGGGADARLIGVEYIITARLFQRLSLEERRLWHSHSYEVISGSLVAPGLSRRAERDLMRSLVGSYGKAFHFWQVDRGDPIPLGVPQLMMSPTRDGQVDPALVLARDARLRVSTPKRRWDRSGIAPPEKLPGADSWELEPAVQLNVEQVAPAAEDLEADLPAPPLTRSPGA